MTFARRRDLIPTAARAASVPIRRSARKAAWDAAALAACLGAAAGLSLLLGQDANWDLQNYHFYDPWAWVHGQRGYSRDIVAAQLQTYHNPLPDLPFYRMVEAGWDPRTIAAIMAVPAGLAFYFLWKLAVLLFGNLPRLERWTAVGATVAVGATSAIGLGVLGTTMNEWPGTACVAAALFLVARDLPPRTGAFPLRTLALAGLLCGLATGAKFTFGTYAIGLCTAILLRGPFTWAAVRTATWDAFRFGVLVLAGTIVTAGAWMWSLWTHFRNPIFPYANVWFKSPWWGQYEVIARVYGPHTLTEWLAFPFSIAAPPPFYVAEVPYVDGRIPAVFALALVLAGTWLVQRRLGHRADEGRGGFHLPASRRLAMVGVFFAVSFLVWAAVHSIFRYLVPLALVSGALIAGMLFRMVLAPARAPAVIMAALMLIGTTVVADWWRTEFGKTWFAVTLPAVEPDALVLLTGSAPMSYVLPHFPRTARFLGINNSISDARRQTLMEETIARTIRDHPGPVYALSFPWGSGAAPLRERGLVELLHTCAPIATNMRTSPIELCRVARLPAAAAR